MPEIGFPRRVTSGLAAAALMGRGSLLPLAIVIITVALLIFLLFRLCVVKGVPASLTRKGLTVWKTDQENGDV